MVMVKYKWLSFRWFRLMFKFSDRFFQDGSSSFYPHDIANGCCNRLNSQEGKMRKEYMYVPGEVRGGSYPCAGATGM